jgi:hypothetical protein
VQAKRDTESRIINKLDTGLRRYDDMGWQGG